MKLKDTTFYKTFRKNDYEELLSAINNLYNG